MGILIEGNDIKFEKSVKGLIILATIVSVIILAVSLTVSSIINLRSAMEEQMAVIEEVNTHANQSKQLSAELNELISKFNI